jgi:hypothetical protein
MNNEASRSTERPGDGALIEAALAVIRKGKARAPADFLLLLAIILGTVAACLLVGAVLADGVLRDLLLNLAAEVVGALLTVVLIDGLWKRLEASASDTLDALTAELERRKGSALTEAERAAWSHFVEGYRQLERSESARHRIRALGAYRQRVVEIESLGAGDHG